VKLVVYGPQKRLGAVEGESVIDLNLACASYLASHGHPLPVATADASVPSELGAFIEAEQRGLDTAQRAIDHAKGSDDPSIVPSHLANLANSTKLPLRDENRATSTWNARLNSVCLPSLSSLPSLGSLA